MHLTNIEVMKSIAFGIYLYSLVIYLKELFAEFKDEKPKVFSEWFWYVILLIGGFAPIFNTIICYQIYKSNK